MILKDFQTIHIPGYNCLHSMLASVALYVKRDHELMFTRVWNFIFRMVEGKTFDEAIKLKTETINSLERYHGIKLSYHKKSDINIIINEFKKQLEIDKPIAIFINCYWLPWDNFYHKINWCHYIFIIGYNDEEKLFYCKDPLHERVKSLPTDEFINGFYHYLTYELVEYKEHIDWKSIIRESLEYLSNSDYDTFTEIRNFASKISDIDLKKENEGYSELWQSPLVRIIGSIMSQRIGYSKLLRFISDKYRIPYLLSVSKDMDDISIKWGTIKNMLVRASMTEAKDYLLNISKKIFQVADLEEEVAKKLKDIITLPEVSILHPLPNLGRVNVFTEYKQIELRNYFNNNAFGIDASSSNSANINGDGIYIIADEHILNEKIIVGEMLFKLPKIAIGNNANINCNKQYISIKEKAYSNILLLAFGDGYGASDILTIKYKDGTKSELKFSFNSWLNKCTHDESVTAWSGQAYCKSMITMTQHISLLNRFKLI